MCSASQVGKRDYPPAICCDPERYSGIAGIAAATGDAIGHHHVASQNGWWIGGGTI